MVDLTRLGTVSALMVMALALMIGACGDDKSGGSGFNIGDDLVVTVSPTTVTFGTVEVSTHAERVLTVTHAGTSGTVRLRKVWLDSESDELTITQPGLTELQPSEQTTLTVLYDPVDGEQDSGTVMIETNVPSGSGALTLEIPVETLTQSGFLRAIPSPVDFGEVESGNTETKVVTLVNVGSQDLTVREVTVKPGNDGDFALELAPEPATYAPNENFNIELSYTPTRGGADTGRLDVTFEVDGETLTLANPVTLLGREVGPKLTAFPNPVDFGWRESDVTHSLPLTLSNQGSRDLRISNLAMADWSSDTVTFSGQSTSGGELIVEPGGVLPLTIEFTPTNAMIQTTAPIAALMVTSNDSAEGGELPVNVFGRAEAPVLQVNPPDFVDYGYVAQNLTTLRKISLYNAGSAPLNVTGISLSDNPTGEFAIETDEGFAPLSSSPSAGILNAGEYKEVRITFTNEGAPNGTQFGKLLIESDDGQRPAWEVDLKAQRAGAPTCTIDLVPGQLDFGTVPRGNKRTMTMNLVNTGSGDCSFHSAFVNDCASFFGFFGGVCDDPNTTVQQSGTSDYYKVTLTPLAIQNGLRPGEVHPIEVTFTPPDSAPIFGDELVDYAGLLAVRIIDPYSGSLDPVVYPQALGGASAFPPNLHAKSGVANLAVLPSEVDFGLTTLGCHSQTIDVTAYNVGTAPLNLTRIEMQGCTPEFEIKESPGLPLTMNPDDAVVTRVVYAPQDLVDDSCGLAFYTESDTPEIVVPLQGRGTLESEHTDEYIQTTGQNVDVLFVVDNSGSMSDEQNNLASNFASFIGGAATWQNDYHIGVTSTDLDADAGRLLRKGQNPRFVTDATWEKFQDNVKLGDNGSGTEQGLSCAQQALTLPLTADSSNSCNSDADCSGPERCWDGFCGGANRGFLREDAALEIVFVSDEEDSSTPDLNFFINFFKSIKGFYNDNLFHAHAIVGPQGGCSSSSGSAAAGLRYIDLANATGGQVASICDANFSAGLSSIGDIAFGLKTQFFLTRVAEPSTIEVTVAGAGCTAQSGGTLNWTYLAESNSVVFEESGGCMPQANDQILIYYETICFLE